MRLKDRAIIVTGSMTGIVAEGARVLVHGTNEERAKSMVEELGGAAAYHLDDRLR